MLNSFIFINPPLPEELIRTYTSARLRVFVRDMQRNTRMARMSGRTSDQDQMRDELNQVVLRSMLECGMQKAFPANSIDPDWTKETLETVMSLYDQEFRAFGPSFPTILANSRPQISCRAKNLWVIVP